jgi:hypothetical protein
MGKEPATGIIDNSDEIALGIVVDYDTDDKIVRFEVSNVYTRVNVIERKEEYIRRHLSWVNNDDVKEDAPLASVFVFYFHATKGYEVTSLNATEDDRILLGICPSGHLRCFMVKDPLNNIRVVT